VGTVRSRIEMADNQPFLMDPRSGLYSLAASASNFAWNDGSWPSDVFWLEGDIWLVHDSLEYDTDPLFTVDLSNGDTRFVGGSGIHQRAGSLFKPAYNWWRFSRWKSDRVMVFDESHLRLAFWSEEGLSGWMPLSGSWLRSIEERTGGMVPERDVDGIVPLSDLGLLIYGSCFDNEQSETRVLLLLPDGTIAGKWVLPLKGLVRSMTAGPGGRIFLNSDTTLYEWENLETAVRDWLKAEEWMPEAGDNR
jgi:hypothetical protein